MREGKFDLLDLQKEELSDEEMRKVYNKDTVGKFEGYDSDKTKKDEVLQKLEERLFNVGSKLDKNPDNKKLIEEYAKIETELKKIEGQRLDEEKNLGSLVSLKETIENDRGLFDGNGINSHALEGAVDEIIESIESGEEMSADDYPKLVKRAMELIVEENNSVKPEEEPTLVDNLFKKDGVDETPEVDVIARAEELGVELEDDFKNDIEKLRKIKDGEMDMDADFIEEFREKYLGENDSISKDERRLRKETIDLYLSVKEILDEVPEEKTVEPKTTKGDIEIEKDLENIVGNLKGIALIYETLESGNYKSEKEETITGKIKSHIEAAINSSGGVENLQNIIENSDMRDDEKEYVKKAIKKDWTKQEATEATSALPPLPETEEMPEEKRPFWEEQIYEEIHNKADEILYLAARRLEALDSINQEMRRGVGENQKMLEEIKKVRDEIKNMENKIKILYNELGSVEEIERILGDDLDWRKGRLISEIKDIVEEPKEAEVSGEVYKLTDAQFKDVVLFLKPGKWDTAFSCLKNIMIDKYEFLFKENFADSFMVLEDENNSARLVFNKIKVRGKNTGVTETVVAATVDILFYFEGKSISVIVTEMAEVKEEVSDIEVEEQEPAIPEEPIKETAKETPKPEPRVERGKISRSLRESLEGIKDTIDVLTARLNKESEKLKAEGLSKEEEEKIMEETERILKRLALLGLGRETVRTSIAVEGSLSSEEERKEIENIAKEHRLDLELYKEMRVALNEADKSFDENLKSKSPEVQETTKNFIGAFPGNVKERIKRLFTKSGKKPYVQKINKKETEEISDAVKNVKSVEDLKEMSKELKEKAREGSQEFLGNLTGYLERFANEGNFEGLSAELSELKKDLDEKKIDKKGKEVLNSFLDRFKNFRKDKVRGEVDKLFEEKKDILEEKLKNARNAEGFGSLVESLKEMRKGISDENMALFTKLLDFGENNFLDNCADAFAETDNADNKEDKEGIKEYIKRGRELAEKELNKEGAFGGFMMQLFDEMEKLRKEKFEGKTVDKDLTNKDSETESETNPEINETEKKVVEFIESITDNVEQVKNACDEFRRIKKSDDESFGKFVKRIGNPFIRNYLEKNNKIAEIKEMKVKEVFSVVKKYIKDNESEKSLDEK